MDTLEQSAQTHTTADALISELRELSRDVTGDPLVRRRRLVVLRRLEHVLQDDDARRLRAIA